jgi:hypothetical protein
LIRSDGLVYQRPSFSHKDNLLHLTLHACSSLHIYIAHRIMSGNSVLGLLHRAAVDDIGDFSETDAASIFRVEVCRWRQHVPMKRRQNHQTLHGVTAQEQG